MAFRGSPDPGDTLTRQPERVLVVEDDRAFRRILERVLVQAGYDVVSVADGRMAMARAAAERFDLVLSDVLLPEVDGLRLAQWMEASGVPVVLMTGCVGVTPALVADYPNVVSLVAKPIGLQELLRVVDDAVFGCAELAATA